MTSLGILVLKILYITLYLIIIIIMIIVLVKINDMKYDNDNYLLLYM